MLFLQLRQLLSVPAGVDVTLERYSDSAASYIVLDSENPGVYKQLYRAAKAKLRLRIKATTKPQSSNESTPTNDQETPQDNTSPPRYNYLDTVLSSPLAAPAPTSVADAPAASAMAFEKPKMKSAGNQLFGKSSIDVPSPQSHTTPPHYRVFTLGQDNLSHPTIVPSHGTTAGAFCIDCNNCGQSIPNEHYHCSICDGGDYDLCQDCVNRGALCPAEGHWLIKRFVQNGVVTNSTTETIAPRKEPQPKEQATPEEVPALAPEKAQKVEEETPKLAERTCNACFQGMVKPSVIPICDMEKILIKTAEFDESKLVTCKNCPDYDLCITCLIKNGHGHHPGHTFALIHDRKFGLKNLVLAHCRPGRQNRHAAICDGCDKVCSPPFPKM